MICETVPRLFPHDGGYRMEVTESQMTRNPFHPSRQSEHRPISPRRQGAKDPNPVTD